MTGAGVVGAIRCHTFQESDLQSPRAQSATPAAAEADRDAGTSPATTGRAFPTGTGAGGPTDLHPGADRCGEMTVGCVSVTVLGGFGPQPAILVLQADGTYHPAQIVAAVDGNLNAASIVTITPPPVSSILPQSQPDANAQRMPQTGFPQPMPSVMTQIPMSATSQPTGSIQQIPQQLYSFPGVTMAEVPQTFGISVVDPTAQPPAASYALNSMTPVQSYDYPARSHP